MEEKPPEAITNDGKRRRTHQRKLTDADKVALIEVLKRPDVRVNGKLDVTTVARMTGLSYGQVYAFIRSDRYWHAQVAEADVGKIVATENEQIDTAIPVGITISNAQFEEYRALIRQNKKMLGADWEKLGMTEEAGKRMEHYATIGTAPTGMVLRVTTGQLISNLELLDRIIKADSERVLTGKLPEEKDKNGEPRDPEQVERDWRYMVYSGMKLQLDMFSHVHKVQAVMARVMKDLYLMNGSSAPKPKGEFETQVTAVSDRDST
jgi:hypothetical protein